MSIDIYGGIDCLDPVRRYTGCDKSRSKPAALGDEPRDAVVECRLQRSAWDDDREHDRAPAQHMQEMSDSANSSEDVVYVSSSFERESRRAQEEPAPEMEPQNSIPGKHPRPLRRERHDRAAGRERGAQPLDFLGDSLALRLPNAGPVRDAKSMVRAHVRLQVTTHSSG